MPSLHPSKPVWVLSVSHGLGLSHRRDAFEVLLLNPAELSCHLPVRFARAICWGTDRGGEGLAECRRPGGSGLGACKSRVLLGSREGLLVESARLLVGAKAFCGVGEPCAVSPHPVPWLLPNSPARPTSSALGSGRREWASWAASHIAGASGRSPGPDWPPGRNLGLRASPFPLSRATQEEGWGWERGAVPTLFQA